MTVLVQIRGLRAILVQLSENMQVIFMFIQLQHSCLLGLVRNKVVPGSQSWEGHRPKIKLVILKAGLPQTCSETFFERLTLGSVSIFSLGLAGTVLVTLVLTLSSSGPANDCQLRPHWGVGGCLVPGPGPGTAGWSRQCVSLHLRSFSENMLLITYKHSFFFIRTIL